MQIGRGPRNRVYRPDSNNTMFERAKSQLEGHAQAQGKRYSNALNVDGPNMVFWVNRNGAIPCSCRASNAASIGGDMQDIVATDVLPTSKQILGSNTSLDSNTRESKVSLVSGVKKSLSSFEFQPDRNSKITPKETILSSNLDEYIASGEYAEDDILDALDEDIGNSAIEDPFNLFADKISSCAVCLGAGYIDAWQPQNGLRMVFDTSNVYNFFCEECPIDDSVNPTRIDMTTGGTITWTTSLPLVWDEIIRANLYNGINLIHPDWYDFTWSVPNLGLSGTCDAEGLADLQNVETKVILQIVAKEDFPFTHAELIFMFAPLVRGQIPEMPQAYEDEYETWQASTTFELPINVDVAEGDYITEAKYKRVWKVNSVNIRKTAGNTIFGISVDVRALHRMEKLYYQLGVFKSVPYSTTGQKYP